MRRAMLPLVAALFTISVLPARADNAVHGVTMTVYNGFSDMNSQPWITAPEQEPCFTGIVPNVESDWGGDAAAESCDADFFLVHFSGWLTVPESGAWEFLALVDDGWHMTINDQLINDNWVPKGCGGWWSGPNEGFIELTAGVSYELDAWMYEWGGGACAILYYGSPTAYGIVPTEWLTTSPLPEPTPTIEPTPTATPTEEPSPSQEPSIEPSPTPSPEITPSPTVSSDPSPLPSVPPSVEPSRKPQEPSPTPTPTETPPAPSLGPSVAPTPTPEPSVEPSPSAAPVEEVVAAVGAVVEEVAAFVGDAAAAVADQTVGRVTRLGSDMSPEQKKTAQPVAVAIVISQVASAAVAAATASAAPKSSNTGKVEK